MLRPLFALLFFISSSLLAKPPSITNGDAKNKVTEILRSHACYHKLNKDLIKRSFQIMVEELDPLKLYFLSSEVDPWVNGSDELCEKALEDYNQGVFTEYLQLYALIEQAIERRNRLEKTVVASIEKPLSKSFKDIQFVSSEDSLLKRLCDVRSLHEETLSKLKEDPSLFLQKITKRRVNHEVELLGKNTKEREEMALTYAIKAIAASLDSQTHYFTPKEANQFLIQVQQRLFGIGAQLRDDVTGLSIVKIIEGSPAFSEGSLKIGDTIVAVDKQSITGMDISEAVELIRGPEGTKVKLTVLNENKDLQEVILTRGEIVIQETRLEKTVEPFGDGVIAILHLYSFYQDEKTSSAQDIAKALNEIQENFKIKGVVLDLRFNAGGLLTQAVSVCGQFIKPGVVVSIKDNTGTLTHLRCIDKKPLWEGPLVVVTNKASASAAEIVAQTLQDYGRALIIGDQTSFGKGTFQTFTLDSSSHSKVNPKGEYKVTRGLYYTVSGKSPQLYGVSSDIVVDGPLAYQEFGEKHSKFPLQPDEIASNFVDKMEDVSLFQKIQLERIYEIGKQQIDTSTAEVSQILKNNTEKRLGQNKFYQEFVTYIKNLENESEENVKFQNADFQMEEAINVIKDFIMIQKTKEKAA